MPTCWAGFFESASHFDPADPEPLLEVIHTSNNLDLADRDGLTLLHYAAREGHFDAVRMLVEVGVKTEVQDRECATPCHTLSVHFRGRINR